MANNITLNAGSGGDTVAADDVGGVKYQVIKVAAGGEDSAQYGGTIHRKVAAGTSADATNIKASAGVVYGVVAVNTGSAACYLHFYNSASAPTVGTTTPVVTFPLPASGGIAFPLTHGMAFSTGIGLGIATTVGGSTGVTADSVVVTTIYV